MQTSFESQKEQLSQTLAEKQAEVENLDQELQAAIAQAAAEEEARRKAEEEARRKAQEEAAAAAAESSSSSNTTSSQSGSSGNQNSNTSSGSSSGNTTSSSEVLTAEVPAVEVLIVEHLTAEAAHPNRVQVPDPVPAVQADPAQAMQVLQV